MFKKEDLLTEIYSKSHMDPYHEEGEILGSMTTLPINEAVRTVVHYISKNLGDPRLFKSLSKLGEELSFITKDYLGLPSDYPIIFTSGGTEGNILSIYALSRYSGRNKIVFPDTVHHSVMKACRLLGLECIGIPTDNLGVMDYSRLKKLLSNRDKILVVTMGSTELGSVDDLGVIMDLLLRTETPLHIDAAFGGFTFPFTHEKLFREWINTLSENIIFTFSSDYHKFPGAPIPSGMVMFPVEMEKFFGFEAPYMPMGLQWGLLGTRPGFSIPASLVTLLYLGREGLSRLAVSRLEDARWFLGKIRDEFSQIKTNEPLVPISCFWFNEQELSMGLMDYLWDNRLFVYKCSRVSGLRIVHMPHVSRVALEKVIEKMKEYFDGKGRLK